MIGVLLQRMLEFERFSIISWAPKTHPTHFFLQFSEGLGCLVVDPARLFGLRRKKTLGENHAEVPNSRTKRLSVLFEHDFYAQIHSLNSSKC